MYKCPHIHWKKSLRNIKETDFTGVLKLVCFSFISNFIEILNITNKLQYPTLGLATAADVAKTVK